MRRCRGAAALILAVALEASILASLPAHANELSVLAGATEQVGTEDSTYAWQAALRYNVLPYAAASLSWINEGHLEDHHRDGAAAQAWGLVPFLDKRLSIGIGAGVYRYDDTRFLPAGSFENVHGWAPIYSLAATYYPGTRWFAQAMINHVRARGDVDTNTFLAGVGYRLRTPSDVSATRSADGSAPSTRTGYEVMPFAGMVVVNKPGSESGVGSGVEFRMGLEEHLDWTLTLLNEDVSEGFHRTGLGTQVWLVSVYLDRRVTLGFGAGLYAFIDDERLPDSGTRRGLDVAGLLTITTGCRLSDRWFARFNWNRVETGDNRDTDNFLMGLGYRWDQ